MQIVEQMHYSLKATSNFNPFVFVDEPDPRVVKAIDELISLLEKGNVEVRTKHHQKLEELKRKRREMVKRTS